MNVKYQIFLSSTHENLRAERRQVTKAILEMGHLPIDMAMFDAGDEEQWQLVVRAIEQSDYFLVIAGHRYGPAAGGGVSSTEREYDYAFAQGVPVLAFLIDGSAPRPAGSTEIEAEERAALARFRSRVESQSACVWRDARDLYARTARALARQFHARPRPGWIPATAAPGAAVVDELSRLSRENAELRGRLAEAGLARESPEIRRNRELIDVLRQTFIDLPGEESGESSRRRARLLEVFRRGAPSYAARGQRSTRPFRLAIADSLGIEEADLSPGFDAWQVLRPLLDLGLLRQSSIGERTLTEKGRALLRSLSLQQETDP